MSGLSLEEVGCIAWLDEVSPCLLCSCSCSACLQDPARGNAAGRPWWEKDAHRARGQGPVEPSGVSGPAVCRVPSWAACASPCVSAGLQSEWHVRDAQAPSENGHLRAAICSPLPPSSLPSRWANARLYMQAVHFSLCFQSCTTPGCSSGSSYTPFSGSGFSTTPDSVLQPHAEDRHKTPFTV